MRAEVGQVTGHQTTQARDVMPGEKFPLDGSVLSGFSPYPPDVGGCPMARRSRS